MLMNTPFEQRHYSDDEAVEMLNAYLQNANPPAAEHAAVTYLIQTFPQAGRYVDYARKHVSAHRNSAENDSLHSQTPRRQPGMRHLWGFEWDVMTQRMHILPDNERRAARIALAILNRENTVSLYDLPRDPQALADLLSLLSGAQDTP